jgi:hypothetical protein
MMMTIPDMLGTLRVAIDALHDPQVRPRLTACLPMLCEAIDNWAGPAPDAGLILATATPASALIVSCHGWPNPSVGELVLQQAGVTRHHVALAVVNAVESPQAVLKTNVFVYGCAALLGAAGIAAQRAAAARIIDAGGTPLAVALLERREKVNVAVLITTIPAPLRRRVLH